MDEYNFIPVARPTLDDMFRWKGTFQVLADMLLRTAKRWNPHLIMAVYVDTMRAPFRGMLMCHMIADTEHELHAMAAAIGMSRAKYQRDHYDIPMDMKELAIRKGAREIGMRELVSMVFLARVGHPMGKPETAVARVKALRRQGYAPHATVAGYGS